MTSLWPAAGVVDVALATVFSPRATSFNATRYPSLDGLRGYLALAVFVRFLHLDSYLRSGTGCERLSQLLQGVTLFFMITGFLFWSKSLMDDQHRSLVAPLCPGRYTIDRCISWRSPVVIMSFGRTGFQSENRHSGCCSPPGIVQNGFAETVPLGRGRLVAAI